MYIETHILQSFVPSNPNRDETGNPKSADFGGARRARISSQSLKYAIRHSAEFEPMRGDLGTRTQFLGRLLDEPLREQGKKDEHDIETVVRAMAEALKKDKGQRNKQAGEAAEEDESELVEDEPYEAAEERQPEPAKKDPSEHGGIDSERAAVMLFLAPDELPKLVSSLVANWDKLLQEAKRGESRAARAIWQGLWKHSEEKLPTSAPDIALFGRFLAKYPIMDIDAASQFAHAISTHRTDVEQDYFTAVDDLATEEERGAAMLGDIMFHSATYYRYSCVDWDQLVASLHGDRRLASQALECFLLADVRAIPGGKKHSFGHDDAPDFVLGVVREHSQPLSLANAFEKPIRRSEEGFVAPSIRQLDHYWAQITRVYGAKDVHPVACLVRDEVELPALGSALVPSLNDWLTKLLSFLPSAAEAIP